VTIKQILLIFFGIKTLSYIKKYLGSPTDIDVERLQVEYEKLKDENLRLKKTVEELKKEVKNSY